MEEYVKYTKVMEVLNNCIREIKEENQDESVVYAEGRLDSLKRFKNMLVMENQLNRLGS